MMRLVYAGGSLDTSDEIAAAVLQYAAALANHDRADTVDVPALGLPAGATTIELLVGPASQFVSQPIDDQRPAPDGTAFLADIEERRQKLEHRWITPETGAFDWDL